ncbi:MAG TPA: hypothetical protein ENG63_06760 [Candidatus Desulfofervidus auxilii]|uniref:Uncharacterized protein n=1 Tax=Desulfofervidus auxilii TaxID=1621989 RepID=A0A7C0Y509_DESA2|nr:hypothetical protein [Candidatus Desulfofervidus auxilii]
MDPIWLIGAGGLLKGLTEIGYGTGLFESPEERAREKELEWTREQWEREMAYKEARRKAALEYLLSNLKPFQEPTYQFREEDYADILRPVKEMQEKELLGQRNLLALQGQARGGIGTELMSRYARRMAQDYDRLITQLAREGEREAWRRAMQKYLTDVARVKTIAGYQ